ncbi:MAG TPA: pyridoxal-dependent decarboxylase, partial [Candidatus Binataceae bacterium]|nr:pyridoxal-dependent decarboxylase [Candidatus Binataceae bacterium]
AIRGPSEALFPPWPERQRIDDYLTRELARAQERVAAGPAMPTLDMDAFRRELAGFDFAVPRPLPALLDWSVAMLEHGVVHLTHPRYFGLFNPSPSFPAQCADRIVGSFNPQVASSATSPAAVALEAHVIRMVAQRAGFPAQSAGHFTSGGSEANYTALLCALTRAHPQFAADGARAFPGPPVFYTSKECHRSWVKIAHQAGIGRSAARLVATDGSGRMSTTALASQIAADLASGCVPVMIVATAGTTNAGMIDPLSDCAELAERQGLWYHIDAAWGGAMIASVNLRSVLAGLERADSATIDAHKWFATTMGCGMFLVRNPGAPSAAFQVAASYMPSHELSVDPYMNSAQWSRRFLGLRLFLSLASGGWAGHAAHIERAVAQTARIRQGLEARGWSILNDSPLAVLTVVPPPAQGDPRAVVERVLKSGRAWVSLARFEERDVIRICVTHGETTEQDLSILVESLTQT